MKHGPLFSSLNTEELITLSPLLLQAVLDTVPTGVQVLKSVRDGQGEIVDFEYILGNEISNNYTDHEKNLMAENLKRPDIFQDLVKGVNAIYPTPSVDSFSINGSNKWFHITYRKFGDGIMLSIEDITDKKILESSNSEARHMMQQIADTTPDIIYIMDLQTGLVSYTNRQIAKELGYSKEQIEKMKNPLVDLFHEDDLEAMKDHLKKVKSLPDNTVLEIEHRMKNNNGELSWYCTRTSVFKRNITGEPVEKMGVSHNITDRKEQEAKLMTNLNLLKQAEEIVEMGTWFYDLPTNQFCWSEGMYRLFDLPKETKVNPEIYLEFVSEKEKEKTGRLVEMIRKAEPIEERIQLQLPGKIKRMIQIKAIGIRDDKGKMVKSIGVDRDITDQVKLEEKIDALNENVLAANHHLAKVNLEMQTFTSIAANDYKETLKHLYTNLEYITTTEAKNLNHTARANIRRAQAAIQKLKLLTEDIIIYSSIKSLDGGKSQVNVNELLETIKTYVTKKIKEEDVQIDCANLPVLYGYPALLSLMFHHLIDNSIKFHQQGKKIIIHINCDSREGLTINNPLAVPGKKYDVISITDNGHGFNPEHATDIFKMFFRIPETRNHKGSGMGLAICKKIMDIHGGFITAESVPENGANFYCYFPSENDHAGVQ